MNDPAFKIPHDVVVLREFIYSLGDRSWTEAEREHVYDLCRAIWKRRTGKRLPPQKRPR